MKPDEFRNAIDDSWPIEARFLIEQILRSWEDDIQRKNNISDGARCLIGKMESGWLSRLRAKGWRALTEEVGDRIISVEGVDSFSAEKENHEEQSRHPEPHGPNQQGPAS